MRRHMAFGPHPDDPVHSHTPKQRQMADTSSVQSLENAGVKMNIQQTKHHK